MKKNENIMSAVLQLPPVHIPQNIVLAEARHRLLPNGLRMYYLPATGDGVIRFSFVFRAGSSLQSVPFSASATVNLLSEGSARYEAHEIAERLDFYGSYFDAGIDRDYAVVTFCCLNRFLDETLDVASEIVLHPSFPEHEVSIYASKRKQQLAVERSKVAFRARELFAGALFGAEHPYGVSHDQALYDDLRRDDVAAFYASHYTAGNCFVVVTGDIDDAVADKVAALAGQLPAGGNSGDGFSIPEPESAAYRFLPHEGAVQSAIRIGRLLFPRTHPDFIGMQLLSTVLGGYFGSRLVRNLREERGYTYSVFSGMVNLEYSGYLAIAAEVAAGATDDAIEQVFAEMERLGTEPVPDGELEMVKNIVVGEVMRILDGPFGIADITIENIQNRSGNSYLQRFLDEIKAATPQSLLDLARRYLVRDRFTVAVVGPSQTGAGR